MRPVRSMVVALALCAVSFLLAPAALADARFYLQQEEVRGPDRPLAVGVRGVAGEIEFTVYRAAEPLAFLRSVEDVHRLTVEGTALRGHLNAALAAAPEEGRPAIHGPVAPPDGDATRFVYVASKKVAGPFAVEGDPRAAAPYPLVEFDRVDPGLYLIEGREGNHIAYCLAFVTDLVVVLRRGQGEVLAYSVDRRTGRRRPGAAIEVAAGGRTLARATTGPDGLARIEVAGERPRLTVLAADGRHVALADPEFFPASVDGRLGYLLTDRPLYQAGETVHFAGFLRDLEGGRHVLPSTIPAEMPFEVLDPSGEAVLTGTARGGPGGRLEGSFVAPAGRLPGGWRLVVRTGGGAFATEFRVEAFRKPPFAVTVAPDVRAAVGGARRTFAIDCRLYSGGRIASGRVEWKLYRSRFDQPLFRTTGLASFYSAAEYRSFKARQIAAGEAEWTGQPIEVPVDPEWDGHPYHLRLDVTVRGEGRDRAAGSGTIALYPAAIRLDVETDRELYRVEETMTARLRAVDLAGAGVATGATLVVRRRGRRYPKGGHAGPWQPGRFEADREDPETPDEVLLTRDVAIGPDGTGTFDLPVAAAGELEIEVSTGEGPRAARATAIAWASAGAEPVPYGGDSIRIVPDRATYAAGETARVLLLLPASGVDPLVTVEGHGILSASSDPVAGNVRVLEVPITAEMAPNVFVRATLVRGGGVAKGGRALVVPPVERVLDVAVAWDRSDYRPGQPATVDVTVTDASGDPVETDVVLSVVDEALYALAPDRLPALVTFFHPLRRSNVGGGHSVVFRGYDHARPTERLPAVEFAEEKEKKLDSRNGGSGGEPEGEEEPGEDADPARPGEAPMRERAANGQGAGDKDGGGDDGDGDDGPAARSRFESTALWRAAVRTGPDGRCRVTFAMPDDLTAWRLTARTVDGATRVGEVRSTVVARLPLQVRLSAPPSLVAGDVARVRAVVTNASGRTLEGVEIELAGRRSTVGELADGAEATVVGDVVADAAGTIALESRATAGAEGDAEHRPIVVRPHGIETGRSVAGRIEGPLTTIDALTLPAGADPATARLVVRITPGYRAALEQALPYLIGFPHGCTEQTMSRFGPDLVADRARRLLGGVGRLEAAELARFVSAGLTRLYELQHDDGGWGWWTDDATNAWMTAYVLEGLLQAADLDVAVDRARVERGLVRLAALAADGSVAFADRAYAVEVLARGGTLEPALLDAVFDDDARADAGPLASAHLLVALGAADRRVEADHLVAGLAATARAEGLPWGEPGSTDRSTDAILVTARVVQGLLAHDPGHGMIRPALDALLAARSGGRWRSTRDTAAACHALAGHLLVRREAIADGGQVEVAVGDESRTVALDGPPEALTLTFAPGTIAIRTDRPDGLFYSAHLVWFETGRPIAAAASGFRVVRRYFRLVEESVGDRIVHRATPLEGPIGPDDTILVEVEVATDERREFVMVRDPRIASAVGIEHDREIEIVGRPEPARPDHRGFAPDETVFFLTRLEPGAVVLRYLFRPTLGGTYHALPASAERMYYPEVRGHSAEAVLEVE